MIAIEAYVMVRWESAEDLYTLSLSLVLKKKKVNYYEYSFSNSISKRILCFGRVTPKKSSIYRIKIDILYFFRISTNSVPYWCRNKFTRNLFAIHMDVLQRPRIEDSRARHCDCKMRFFLFYILYSRSAPACVPCTFPKSSGELKSEMFGL